MREETSKRSRKRGNVPRVKMDRLLSDNFETGPARTSLIRNFSYRPKNIHTYFEKMHRESTDPF